jgi:beta-glucosidase
LGIGGDVAHQSYYPNGSEKRVPYSEGVFLGYRHFDRSDVKPLFAFGYGLSYTTFSYSNLSVVPAHGSLNGPITVSFDLKNTGTRDSAEVAELYVGDAHASVPRPVKELKGFSRVNLKPGETRRVSIALDPRSFAFYDVNKKIWSAEPGDFSLLVGRASDDILLKGSFRLDP